MDYFCTFDVSKIIPKNTYYLLYMTFNPYADSLDPMDYFFTFDVSKIIPKTPIICSTWLLIPLSRIYADITLKLTYIGCVKKDKYFWSFP